MNATLSNLPWPLWVFLGSVSIAHLLLFLFWKENPFEENKTKKPERRPPLTFSGDGCLVVPLTTTKQMRAFVRETFGGLRHKHLVAFAEEFNLSVEKAYQLCGRKRPEPLAKRFKKFFAPKETPKPVGLV